MTKPLGVYCNCVKYIIDKTTVWPLNIKSPHRIFSCPEVNPSVTTYVTNLVATSAGYMAVLLIWGKQISSRFSNEGGS